MWPQASLVDIKHYIINQSVHVYGVGSRVLNSCNIYMKPIFLKPKKLFVMTGDSSPLWAYLGLQTEAELCVSPINCHQTITLVVRFSVTHAKCVFIISLSMAIPDIFLPPLIFLLSGSKNFFVESSVASQFCYWALGFGFDSPIWYEHWSNCLSLSCWLLIVANSKTLQYINKFHIDE